MKLILTFCTSVVLIFVAILIASQFNILNITGLGAQLISSQVQNVYKDCIESFTQEKKSDLTIEEANINSDGKKDAIIKYKNAPNCGSAGCVFELCLSAPENTYVHVPFGYAGESLTVKQTVTEDMSDLMLNNDKKLTLSWNGSSYVLLTTNY